MIENLTDLISVREKPSGVSLKGSTMSTMRRSALSHAVPSSAEGQNKEKSTSYRMKGAMSLMLAGRDFIVRWTMQREAETIDVISGDQRLIRNKKTLPDPEGFFVFSSYFRVNL
jgi:hypothetical protein